MSSPKTPGQGFEAIVHASQRLRATHLILGAIGAISVWTGELPPHFHPLRMGGGWAMAVFSIFGWGPYLISWFYSRTVLDMWAKRCIHDGYAPAKAVCDSLMLSGAVEFSGHNATRTVTCLSKHTRFANRMQLDQGLFRFNYGTESRGANITVSFAEDERLGAMALRVTADGY